MFPMSTSISSTADHTTSDEEEGTITKEGGRDDNDFPSIQARNKNSMFPETIVAASSSTSYNNTNNDDGDFKKQQLDYGDSSHHKEQESLSRTHIICDSSSSVDFYGDASIREGGYSESNDEVQQVRDKSKQENQIVATWRIALVVVLIAVGVAVTFVTFRFLTEDETSAFETAFEQFSRTLSDAAIRQQKDIQDGLTAISAILTSYATSSNSTWPFVTMPDFGTHVKHFFTHAGGVETINMSPFVTHDLRDDWVDYATQNHEKMVENGHLSFAGNFDRFVAPVGYHPYISAPDPVKVEFVPEKDRDFYFPSWQVLPPASTYGLVNWNVASAPDVGGLLDAMLELHSETILTHVRPYAATVKFSFLPEEHEAMHSKLKDSSIEHPHSFFLKPIYERVDDYTSPIVGMFTGGFAWDFSLRNLLPEGVSGLLAVIKNNCNQQFTYEIDGSEAFFLGHGDQHNPQYDNYERIVHLALYTHPNFTSTPGHCQYTMHIYPGAEFEESYKTNIPVIYAVVVASTFLLVAIVFFIYNIFVNDRNEKLVHTAAKSNAVISALFPRNFRDRIIMEDELMLSQRGGGSGGSGGYNEKYLQGEAMNLKTALSTKKRMAAAAAAANESITDQDASGKKNMAISRPPLADYFPESTILFADISGFTAWSSVREPYQVFSVLESLFGAFDKLTKRCHVFKVETVGDCYVAASGAPYYHREHAVHMVQFARKILNVMEETTKDLETTLGPDTGDLSLRIGIHSGPVTAGVLRGERARFQLFGDTMNTASRMESTGQEGRIHISHETAELLKKFGKAHWLVKREAPIKVKGKGDIQTYWVKITRHDYGRIPNDALVLGAQDGDKPKDDYDAIIDGETSFLGVRKSPSTHESDLAAREARLVDWNVHMFMDFLKQIIARRHAVKGSTSRGRINRQNTFDRQGSNHGTATAPVMKEGFNPLDEVKEIIRLPEFDSKVAKLQKNHHSIEIPKQVEEQLHLYVTCVAKLYRRNHFHNFEHASHVTMSVIKLLSRIVAPSDLGDEIENKPEDLLRAQLHDHTYGITSDPLTQFACAFSALIHDVDHVGVPNAQLVKEHADIAARYKNRSVAEQNSMVLAWNLLMESQFDDLRLCLCETPQELRRFRNLVINGVMATDITDKELKNLRNARWDKAFSKEHNLDDSVNIGKEEGEWPEQDVRDVINRKATIVIEHLLQASDVAHTMQHWHVYRKWNERFFFECYAAYKAGRSETDPSENWYKGEIGFFDFYVIPLAKKLDTCGVFGKSSDEYLNYALQNREEWKNRGEDVVSDLIKAVRTYYND